MSTCIYLRIEGYGSQNGRGIEDGGPDRVQDGLSEALVAPISWSSSLGFRDPLKGMYRIPLKGLRGDLRVVVIIISH